MNKPSLELNHAYSNSTRPANYSVARIPKPISSLIGRESSKGAERSPFFSMRFLHAWLSSFILLCISSCAFHFSFTLQFTSFPFYYSLFHYLLFFSLFFLLSIFFFLFFVSITYDLYLQGGNERFATHLKRENNNGMIRACIKVFWEMNYYLRTWLQTKN